MFSFALSERKRTDELNQKRDDQLQEIRVLEEQSGQILQSVFQRHFVQRFGVFRMRGEQVGHQRRPILLRLTHATTDIIYGTAPSLF